ncbi:esterase [Shewanella sp. OPT22]|nr:esterase [Shewanella sp. OPT22]
MLIEHTTYLFRFNMESMMKRIILFCLLALPAYIINAADLVVAKEVTLDSKALNHKRQLLVSLPDSYQESDKKYPVIYLLHGQWDMLPAVATLDLISAKLPEFIVIGVQSKGLELKPIDGKSTPFERFLSEEIVPFVNGKYRAADYRILSGHSNSGRFVLDYWLKDKGTFSEYYAFSPSLEDGYISNRIKSFKNSEIQQLAPVVMTMANEGEHMQNPFNEIKHRLEYLPNLSIAIKKFPEQSHQSTKHPSLKFALETSFKGWEPTYEIKVGGLQGLKQHYKNLSSKFGFSVTPPANMLPRLVVYHVMSKDKNALNQVREHIKYAIKLSDENTSSLFEISDHFINNGEVDVGKVILNETCKIVRKNKRCPL